MQVQPIKVKIDEDTLERLAQAAKTERVNIYQMSDKERAAFYYKQLCLIASYKINDDIDEDATAYNGHTCYIDLDHADCADTLDRAVSIARDATKQWVYP